jgi:ABC-2 type transport system ATP-binding protein
MATNPEPQYPPEEPPRSASDVAPADVAPADAPPVDAPPVDALPVAPPEDAPAEPHGAPPSRPVLDAADYDVLMVGAGRRFGNFTAVSGIDLAVRPGTILGVIGPSGAGKTTSLRMITGALRPSTGAVRVLGHDPTRAPTKVRRRVGYMPQLLTLRPELTARENVDMAASLFGMLWPLRGRHVNSTLRLLDLGGAAANRQTRFLSGGMQRRVELASTLVHDPYLVLLDEPTAGNDPILRERIWEELRRRRDAGRTLVVTTQYVSEAEYCDTVALIAHGRLIAYGTPLELRRMPAGGDVIRVETADTFDASRLLGVGGVLGVRQFGFREFDVTLDDAGTGTPAVVAAIGDLGGEVAATREDRPNFEQVFTALVERAMPGGPATE